MLDAIINGKLGLVLSADVIDEANAVLKRKFPKHAVLFPLLLRLAKHERIPKSAFRSSEKLYSKLLGDKADVQILAAAAKSESDYLVTGDKGLLTLKRIGDTGIIQTWKLLKKLRI